MSGVYTNWYRSGTVKVTKNSVNVEGTDTYWANVGIRPGDMFSIDSVTEYEVATIIDNSHLTLKTAYAGANATGSAYRIIRNFTSTMQADLAADAAELLGRMRRYVDADMQTVQGKSAYEIACDNGYVGTEAQWLQSLVGAGEWQALSASTTAADNALSLRIDGVASRATNLESRTNILAECENSEALIRAAYHNANPRGKNLGSSLTAAQISAISDGTYNDLYVGDYWQFSNVPYSWEDENGDTQSGTYSGTMRIMDVNYLGLGSGSRHVLVMPDAYLYRHRFTEAVELDEAQAELKANGYATSYMRRVGLNRATAIFEACFGADHILEYTDYLSKHFNDSGNATSYAAGGANGDAVCRVELPTYMMFYGHSEGITQYRSEYTNNNRSRFNRKMAICLYSKFSTNVWIATQNFTLGKPWDGELRMLNVYISGGWGFTVEPINQSHVVRPFALIH